MKRHCLVSVHCHGNQTDLIKNKDSCGLVPVYHLPGWCMDPWNPSQKGLSAHNPDFAKLHFCCHFVFGMLLGQDFAHGSTAKLSWHVQNSDLIWSVDQKCHQNVFLILDFYYELIRHLWKHYNDIIMGTMASQITSLTIVYWTVYSDTDQSKHQSSVSLAFVWGIHRWLVNSPYKWPVTRKMFPFDDVIMGPWFHEEHNIINSVV